MTTFENNPRPLLSQKALNQMLNILREKIRYDARLASQLLRFMQDQGLALPDSLTPDKTNPIPVSFATKSAAHQYTYLRSAFEGIETVEQVME